MKVVGDKLKIRDLAADSSNNVAFWFVLFINKTYTLNNRKPFWQST
jgi:hypothetical protein